MSKVQLKITHEEAKHIEKSRQGNNSSRGFKSRGWQVVGRVLEKDKK